MQNSNNTIENFDPSGKIIRVPDPNWGDAHRKMTEKTMADLIPRFEAYCKNPNNDHTRRTAVGFQFNRNAWSLDDSAGRIIIRKRQRNNGEKPMFELSQDGKEFIPVPRYENTYWLTQYYFTKGQKGCMLFEDQYEKLRKIYFGEFTPDSEYLKKNFGIDA